MEKVPTFLKIVVLLVSGVGAGRLTDVLDVDDNAMLKEEPYAGAMLEEEGYAAAATHEYCASDRCDGASDKDGKNKIQLMFRDPEFEALEDKKSDKFPMISREHVGEKRGYTEYHYGKLSKCSPLKNQHMLKQKDWPTHMQLNMRTGIWPNSPGNTYGCAEYCKLKIYDAHGKQINEGSEPEVWVERNGHSTDLLAKLNFAGWKPPSCTVGTNLQAHWWKQRFYANYLSGKGKDHLMEDPSHLPVWPFVSYLNKPFEFGVAPLHELYKSKFCALTSEQKVSVVERVTTHRLSKFSYGTYYGRNALRLGSRNFFPNHFPMECPDGWLRNKAEGVFYRDEAHGYEPGYYDEHPPGMHGQ